MNLPFYIVSLALLTGCTNHTAQITASAGEVRQASHEAQSALAVAQSKLEYIDEQAKAVSDNAGYVSDEEPAIFSVLRYGSIAAIVIGAAAIIYTISNRIKI